MDERVVPLAQQGGQAAFERAQSGFRILSQINYPNIAGNKASLIDRLKRLYEKRSFISTQIYLAFGAAVALTAAASLVGWISFDQVGLSQSRVNEGSVPEMSASFGIAQHANTLVSAGPRLAATTNPDEYNVASDDIAVATVAIVADLAKMQGKHRDDERFQQMRIYVDSLTTNIHTIQTGMAESFPRTTRLKTLQEQIAERSQQLQNILVPAEETLLTRAMTSLNEQQPSTGQPLSENEFTQYLLLSKLRSDIDEAGRILTTALSFSDSDAIGPLRESLVPVEDRIYSNLDALEDSELREKLKPMVDHIFELGVGNQGRLDILEIELSRLELQRDLIVENRETAVSLLDEVDDFVISANNSVAEAVEESGQAVLIGKILLLIISAVSIGGALLITWLFIGRVLLRRLQMLSDWMRRMADGDLEVTVDVGGRDEVAEMGTALEVFRHNSLEAQRLNLVERLAQEVQEKNAELEVVLEDLNRAQDQIVMREKLAALGELTAGVAHEIRNPLNFVKNFSEVSEELLQELQETLEEASDNLNDDQKDLIQEVSEDLTNNLERIRSHSERANRIVHDMLMMGRGAGDRQQTDINALLDQYAGLGYHSARAVDPDFQLDLKQDFDPDLGSIEVYPQDMGRVFLNIVSNACDATDEKRRAADDAALRMEERYAPTVWLTTRRHDDKVEVRVKDNGDGIPIHIMESIFNPFFTTKPTGQGTGLGLAMSNDIVREHGGRIRVESEPGEFTEMIVELPIETPSEVAAEAVGVAG